MYFSSIQTATYTITAHAMSQLLVITNVTLREQALNYVQEMALKHSATSRVIINNISGIIKNFIAKNAEPAKIGWRGYCTITVLGAATIYIIFKAYFPSNNDPNNPTSLTKAQRKILNDLEEKEKQQQAALATQNKALDTQQGLLEDAQKVADRDNLLISTVEGNIQQAAEANALLDQLIAELREVMQALDSLPAIQEQEAILERQRAQIESLKGRCKELEKRYEDGAQESSEEEAKLKQIVAEFKQLKEQLLKRG